MEPEPIHQKFAVQKAISNKKAARGGRSAILTTSRKFNYGLPGLRERCSNPESGASVATKPFFVKIVALWYSTRVEALSMTYENVFQLNI
ncbi:hypothetical protein [Bradyrhizobium sp. Mp64]|uniref:hypothetical protein n=1 Tax=Bradyrhizobium sp. Mp64 TaxID=3042158 RepID=UPI00248C29E2|nr:hypothetical protein [Bradyrhizobium sp. Mp64]MDI2103942.1 hypothetical protein [Bradyrhizobium sp. Mp64]